MIWLLRLPDDTRDTSVVKDDQLTLTSFTQRVAPARSLTTDPVAEPALTAGPPLRCCSR